MEKLKSILGLKFIQEIPRENKMAYLISVGMGIGVVILTMIIHYINNTFVDYAFDAYTLFLLLDNLFPISILILFFVLSKKIPIVYNVIKTRIICLLILLLAYIIGFYFPICLEQFSLSCFLWLPLAPLITFLFGIIDIFEYPTQTPLLSTFLYSNIFIIVAAYLATKGITNLLKRIILFIVIGFLICIATATPLIFMHAAA